MESDNSQESKALRTSADLIVSKINKLLECKGGPLLVALDGRSGTGKSTLAEAIARKTDGVVVVSDDFYSGGNDDKWEDVTVEDKVSKAIDWKRIRLEVLEPLLGRKSASWHPLDFKPNVGCVGWKNEVVTLEPKDVIILEGAYSSRPELADLVDLSILVETPEDTRRKRLRDREGEDFMAKPEGVIDCLLQIQKDLLMLNIFECSFEIL